QVPRIVIMSNRYCLISAPLIAAFFISLSPAGAQVPAPTPAAVEAPADPSFTPPANGRLTAAQVRMFIAVRRSTAESAARWPADAEAQINALTRSFEEETRGAAALGVSLEEYRWVSTRVMDAMPDEAVGSDPVLNAIQNAVRSMPAVLADAGAQ